MIDFNPCPHCNQPFGKVTHNDPKLISFENRAYQINVHRTWAGMKWGEPNNYELFHWCQSSNNKLYKIRSKTLEELKEKWDQILKN